MIIRNKQSTYIWTPPPNYHLVTCFINNNARCLGVLRPGVLRPGVLRQGALRPGVLRPGVLRQGVLRPGVLRPGVLRQGVRVFVTDL